MALPRCDTWPHAVKTPIRTVRIRRDAPPTYLDILYTLHAAAQVHLGGQDHCFFEGLWLQERTHEPSVPLYRLHTGS